MNKNIIIIFFVIAFISFLTAEPDQNFVDNYRTLVSKDQKNLEFYGKVVDLDGNSIKDAEVIMHTDNFNPLLSNAYFLEIKTVKIKTDETGNFEYKGFGLDVDVKDIVKEGYEALISESIYEWKNKYKVEPTDFESAPDKRIMYKLRKKNPYAFIIKFYGSLNFRVSLTKNNEELNLIKYYNKTLFSLSEKYGNIYKDNLLVGFSYIKNENDANTVRMYINGGEFILSDKKLYNAPEEGYQKEQTFNLPYGYYPKYFFIKCKGGKYYFFGKCYLSSDKEYINKKFPKNSDPPRATLCINEIYLAPESSGNFEYDPEYTKAELKKLKEKNKK